MRFALLLLPFALACGSITGPERDRNALESGSRIRFVLDNASCRGAISLDFLIDKQVAGVKFLAAGDSAEFKTAAGLHTVHVRATGNGPDVYGEWPAVEVQAPVRVVLTCFSIF